MRRSKSIHHWPIVRNAAANPNGPNRLDNTQLALAADWQVPSALIQSYHQVHIIGDLDKSVARCLRLLNSLTLIDR
jgi:hypothetical protein